jgi:hypothetical protein
MPASGVKSLEQSYRSCSTLQDTTNHGVRSMRHAMWVGVWVVAGCAGEPSKPPPMRELAVAAPPAASIQPSEQGGDVAAKRLLEAKKQGFTVVTKNGDVLFCRTELRTGSHVAKDTTCLTAKELDELHEQTSQDLRNFLKPQLPRPGK